MKIAHIICAFPPYKGGMGNSVFQFAKILAELNHKITVFTPNYSGLLPEEEFKNGFKIIRLKPWLKYGNGAFLPQLLWKLKNFDIVHLHYPFFGGAEPVWLAKIFYGAEFKLVVHYHMDAVIRSLPQKIFSWPSRLIRDSLFKKAEAVTCASLDYIKHSEVNCLYEKYKNKFYETAFGVDIDKFKPANKFEGEEKIILFVGGLDKAHYFKGVEILIKAFSRLADGNCRLLIIGRGELREKYEKQAEELGIKKIKFVSDALSDSDLIKYYQKADVFVMPSINKGEAFGMVLLEAMACAVPVIASNLPGVRNVFQNGVQGLLTEPGDADDLKNKIELMLSDNEKRREMGRAGRKLAIEKYGWKKTGERMEEAYMDNQIKKPKIAVIHDHLGWPGGGERTALIIALELGADFITAYAHPQTYPEYQKQLGRKLVTLSEKVVNLEVVRFFWLRGLFWRNQKILKKYDILIASGQAATETVAQHAKKGARKILYNHTPPRRIFDLYEKSKRGYKWFLRPLYAVFARYWKWVYLKAMRKIDIDIANSENVRRRMKEFAGEEVDYVVWPPILTEKFKWISQADYFLSWARVDEHKRVDLIVKAFMKMPDKKLIVASSGSELEKVREMAKNCPNIKIVGWIDDAELFDLVGRCRAAIYIPINEDAGMTQLEANAAGKPVLGVAEGGLLETMIDGETGILVKPNPDESDIIKAVETMTPQWCLARKDKCVSHARRYDKEIFCQKIKNIVKHENLFNK